ncbi:MAG: hypothetical protein AAB036_11630 [Elusimicrobiota bacterium]
MKTKVNFAALLLTASILPSNLTAASAILDGDDFGPPGQCAQEFFGLESRYSMRSVGHDPIPLALDDVHVPAASDGKTKPDPSMEWAARAKRLKTIAGPSEWHRLEDSWARYASARNRVVLVARRTCTGKGLAQSLGTDVFYLVASPFIVINGLAGSVDGDWKHVFTGMAYPVASAIGLAADSVLTVTLPVRKLISGFRAHRTNKAFNQFTNSVVKLEGLNAAAPPIATPN